MQADYLTAQMKAFRKGERQATIMHQIAKGYTDEQVRLLAEYFAAQTP
jgi:cytochrome c553